jgi:hypothetical protein
MGKPATRSFRRLVACAEARAQQRGYWLVSA